mmetsp:Transcript_33426/g.59410  ORF Transcript_33426/g.59410 Transcript_33426/m.59410 type:complete len:201 (+) Transcript_33426:397-999(+)
MRQLALNMGARKHLQATVSCLRVIESNPDCCSFHGLNGPIWCILVERNTTPFTRHLAEDVAAPQDDSRFSDQSRCQTGQSRISTMSEEGTVPCDAMRLLGSVFQVGIHKVFGTHAGIDSQQSVQRVAETCQSGRWKAVGGYAPPSCLVRRHLRLRELQRLCAQPAQRQQASKAATQGGGVAGCQGHGTWQSERGEAGELL